MLANDASQPAQQCDFEPARSLSWTHPHRNRASAVIRVSYDSLRGSLYPISLSLSLALSIYLSPSFPPRTLSSFLYVCIIRTAIHLAVLSQLAIVLHSLFDMRPRENSKSRTFYIYIYI